MIIGNMVGGTAPIKTLKIVDANNNEYIGIIVGNEVIFTATAEDIKLGKVAGTDSGVVTGTHVCE
jgi:hypothetical protein